MESNHSIRLPLAANYQALMSCPLDDRQLNQQMAEVSHLLLEASTRNVKPLPAIISAQAVAVIEGFVAQLPEIFYQALKAFKQPDAFADYFGVAEFVFTLMQQQPLDLAGVMGRYDVMFQDNNIQLIEANINSRVGGWDHDFLSDQVIGIVQHLAQTYNLPTLGQLGHRPGMLSYFVATDKVLQNMRSRQHSDDSDRVNILIYTLDVATTQTFLPFLTANIQQIPNWHNVEVFLSDDLHQLSFDEQQRVWLQQGEAQKQQIDVVMLTQVPPPEIATENLMKSRAADQLVFPDDPLYELFGNKALMALVQEPFVFEHLSLSQRQWVKAHIPWTVKLNRQEVVWRGDSYQLRQLLTDQQSQFVLKGIDSFGGKDVVVGCFTSAEDWQALLSGLAKNNQAALWIVQQYTPGDRLNALNNELQASEHEAVWGVFGGAGLYGGGIVRIVETNHAQRDGVINAARGASELLILESDG